jgi:tetratricopeptide (TPR) repeat protein
MKSLKSGGAMKNLTLTTIVFLLMICLIQAGLGQEISDLLASGDNAHKNFDNQGALDFYTNVLEMDSTHYEATWKLSRAYVDVGETLSDKEERKAYYKKAESLANNAVEIQPEGAKGHLYLSIAIGRVALDAGKKEQVRLSKEVKASVDKALEYDPNDDIAWHVLGRWHRKMATLGWIQKKFANIFLGGIPKEASVDSSARCFKRAIGINPEHINHHLELGITYEKLKEKEKAIEQYQLVLNLPKKDADDDKHKEHAEKRLKKLQ